jgi:hypothetical protein
VTIPNSQTTTARIKVEAVGNIFFDVSNTDFAITPPVPIQLARFTGRAISPANVLFEWLTLSEVNNYGFEIQQSSELQGTFETIPGSFVAGHGTTLEPQHYEFRHAHASPAQPFYRLKQIDLDGTVNFFDPIHVRVPTGVVEQPLPTAFMLAQNHPNPFNPVTTIRFTLPANASTRLEVFSILGERVALLLDEIKQAGYYQIPFDGGRLSSGVYLCKLTAGDRTAIMKMLLAK